VLEIHLQFALALMLDSKDRRGQYLHLHPYVEGQILGNCRHLKAGGNATNSVANIGLLSGKI